MKYIYVTQGDSPATAQPLIASGDPRIVDAAIRALFEAMAAAPDPLASTKTPANAG